MAEDTSATIHLLHQPKPKTDAERARAYRNRKRSGKATSAPAPVPAVTPANSGQLRPAPSVTPPVTPVTPVTLVTVTPRHVTPVTPSRQIAPITLKVAAFGLAAVGLTINGWFARSLGSTDLSGWMFLGLGVAADLAALALPATAARHWHARQRGTAAVAWSIWAATFAFAMTASIGFASLNVSDVTFARSSRVTPAVTTANAALSDAMAARDRECKIVGKFCREREATVTDRRQAVDAAMASVERTADPQMEAAVHLVSWLTKGLVNPDGNDFAMLRLILLALLPQLGGMLLMVGRVK